MSMETVDTLIVGGGQAGLAMSEHLGRRGVNHLVVERNRIAESWRTARWDSLVTNGPAWHDRFPGLTFDDVDPNGFVSKDRLVQYFEAYSRKINSPVRCGVEVRSVEARPGGQGFRVATSNGAVEAKNLVAATGPFQRPTIPAIVPETIGIRQLHSNHYRNPAQLPEGAALVVGAGASGAQIADELLRSGKRVYLAVGAHGRPPRAYRGKDYCWWLGVLGHWDKKRDPSTLHVPISVSGAHGGHTVDFREFASRGMTLLGRAMSFKDGVMTIAPDLAQNLARGDADYISVLDEADAHIAANGLNLPEEPEARILAADPVCVAEPILELDLASTGITSIIWATGYGLDFSWLTLDAFDQKGSPVHDMGVSPIPGLFFVGLSWLTRRASPFIWGVWHDAEHLSAQIAARGEFLPVAQDYSR